MTKQELCPVCGTPVKVFGDFTKHYEPIAQPKQREWISVDKEMPEFDVPVLACIKSAYDGSLYLLAMMRSYNGDGWLWSKNDGSALDEKENYEDDDEYDVKYWQFLPEPPKEQGE